MTLKDNIVDVVMEAVDIERLGYKLAAKTLNPQQSALKDRVKICWVIRYLTCAVRKGMGRLKMVFVIEI